MRWLRYLVLVLVTVLSAASVLIGEGASAATAVPTVTVAQSTSLGSILVGPNGMTLYYFKKDTANVSNCSGGCTSIWPPLTVSKGTTPWGGAGVTGTFGTITRSNGSTQVTYNGWPLYYYAADTKAGDTNGQGILNLWYAATPTLAQAPAATASSSATSAPSSTTSTSSATLSVIQNSALGPILVGPGGMTVYHFLKDTKNVDNCSGVCATIWPAVTVTGTPTVGAGVTGTVGTITLANGSKQLTYNGWPLYRYSGDSKAGDTNGQGFKSLWYVVAPGQAEAPVAAASTTGSSASASSSGTTLPKTGGSPLPYAAGALLILAGGAIVTRRLRASA